MASPTRKKAKPEEPSELLSSQTSSLVFISHDSRDAELAEAFSKLLSSVSAGVLKSFRSSDRKGTQGIEYGTEWYPELMKNLSAASDVVCLLTQRSIERPWILYEAGVAKGKLNTPVYGIALGITLARAATGPFAQFQNSDDSEDSLTKLVMQLVGRIPNSEPDREAIAMQVRTFKEKAKSILTKLDSPADAEERQSVDETSVAKLFEEVKVMFQDLPSRIEGQLDPKHRKRRRFHPMLFEELMHITKGKAPGILAALALFREDMPWLYPYGSEFYRALQRGNVPEIKSTGQALHTILEITTHGPFARALNDKDDAYNFARESIDVLHHFVERAIEEAVEKASKRKAIRKRTQSK